jgi:solute carrier family 25 (mitochondrial uncoupling protein), member 27
MKDLFFIGISSMFAEICTHPIDFVKTQKQYKKTNISTVGIFKNVFKTDGIRGFYPSIAPAVVRHWAYTTTRVSVYEKIRSEESSFGQKLLAGALAGGTAQLVASPTDLIKVKLQTQKLTNNKSYTPFQIIKSVYKKDGVRGFYYGWKPNVSRAVLVTVGELVAYDTGKQYLLNYMDDTFYCHALASINSGFWSTFLSTPADVIKTRIMADSKNTMIGTAKEIVKNEGVLSLWKGFIPIWSRLAPWQFIFWVSYEQLRLANNMGSFK